jgi:hypothetical protein
MHSTIFSHQTGWFDYKGVGIHPWGLRIKPHSDIVMVNDGMLTKCTVHS